MPAEYLGIECEGVVGGIASLHVIFHYIIILDQPVQYEGEIWTALTVGGPHLMNVKGEYEWRLE